jgi:hypothetical protein
MKSSGKGIIGMKILGQGDLRNRQSEAIKYALSLNLLDAFTIGAESKSEQDNLIQRVAAPSDPRVHFVRLSLRTPGFFGLEESAFPPTRKRRGSI